MSVVYCLGCEQTIDTDFNVEHFIEGTETCQGEWKTMYTGEKAFFCDGCPQTKTWLPDKEDGYWWEIVQCSFCRKYNH